MATPEIPPPPPGSESPGSDIVSERPEILVGGAFIGAFVLAKILKKITT